MSIPGGGVLVVGEKRKKYRAGRGRNKEFIDMKKHPVDVKREIKHFMVH